MSTTSPVKAKPAVKYESYVEDQLARARTRIRLLDVSAATLVFLIATLAYGLGMVLVDSWLGGLPSLVRQGAFALYALAASAYLGITAYQVLIRRVNPYYAAQQVEHALPEAKNSVVNWLDLRDQPLPAAIRGAVSHRAAKDLARADLEQAISARRAGWLGGILGGLFLGVFILFIIQGPTQFLSLLTRTFAPFTEATIATRTQIAIVAPEGGNATVAVGRAVSIAVSVSGKVPDAGRPDSLKLLFRYQETDPYVERPLEQAGSTYEWAIAVPAADVRTGFWYRVAGGDARTDEYRVQARSTPLFTNFEVKYHYRPYLIRADEITHEPNLEAPQGTEVTLVARTNRQVREGKLNIADVKDAIVAERVPEDPQAMLFRFTPPVLPDKDSTTYRIWFTAEDGEKNIDPMPYQIKVIRDTPPRVRLSKPGQDIELPANGVLSLEGLAHDDHGVTGITLKILAGTKEHAKPYRPGKSFKLDSGHFPLQLDYKDFVELEKIKLENGQPLQPGMEIHYWLEAADNCDFPEPNIGKSDRFKVTIKEPEDKQQQQQQQQKEKAKQEQQKHEANQDKKLDEENQKQKDQANQKENQPNKEQPKNEQERKPEDKEVKDKADKLQQALNDQKNDSKPGDKNEQPKDNDAQGDKDKGQQGEKDKGQGDKNKGAQGDKDKGQQGDKDKDQQGDKDKGQQGDKDKGAQGDKDKDQQGDKDKGAQGDKVKGAQGDKDKGQQGDKDKGQQGDKDKGAQGDKDKGAQGDKDKGQQGDKDKGAQGDRNKGQQGDKTKGQQGEKDKGVQGDKGAQGDKDKRQQGDKDKGAQGDKDKGGQSDKGQQGDKDKGQQGDKDKRQQGDKDKGQQGDKDLGAQGDKNKDQQGDKDKGQQADKNKGTQGDKDKGQQADKDKGAQSDKDKGQQGDKDKGQQGDMDKGAQGDKDKGAQGDKDKGNQADKNKGQQGDKDKGAQGDKDKGQQGDKGSQGDKGQGEEGRNGKGKGEEGKEGKGQGDKGDKGKGEQPGDPGSSAGKGTSGERKGPPSGDKPTDPLGPEADPKYQKKAGELQLENFKKKVNKDVLKKANMTEEEYREFLKAYEEMLKRQQANPGEEEKLTDPKQRGGALKNLGPKRVDPKGKGDKVQGGGPGFAPPEFREAYKEFTEKIASPERSEPKK